MKINESHFVPYATKIASYHNMKFYALVLILLQKLDPNVTNNVTDGNYRKLEIGKPR